MSTELSRLSDTPQQAHAAFCGVSIHVRTPPPHPLVEVAQRAACEVSGEMGAVADKLGISRSSLFNKLRGSNEFSLSEAFNLSRILGMTVDELCRLAMKSD